MEHTRTRGRMREKDERRAQGEEDKERDAKNDAGSEQTYSTERASLARDSVSDFSTFHMNFSPLLARVLARACIFRSADSQRAGEVAYAPARARSGSQRTGLERGVTIRRSQTRKLRRLSAIKYR